MKKTAQKKQTDFYLGEVNCLIREARRKHNLSQAEIGIFLGIGPQTISRIEHGWISPKSANLIQFTKCILSAEVGTLPQPEFCFAWILRERKKHEF